MRGKWRNLVLAQIQVDSRRRDRPVDIIVSRIEALNPPIPVTVTQQSMNLPQAQKDHEINGLP